MNSQGNIIAGENEIDNHKPTSAEPMIQGQMPNQKVLAGEMEMESASYSQQELLEDEHGNLYFEDEDGNLLPYELPSNEILEAQMGDSYEDVKVPRTGPL